MTNIILAAQAAGAGGGYSMIIMMVAIFAIMYFFMIRPQQKKIRNFQNSIQEGTKVITAGGVYGTVKKVNIESNSLDLEVSRGVVITVDRNYVFADAASQQQR